MPRSNRSTRPERSGRADRAAPWVDCVRAVERETRRAVSWTRPAARTVWETVASLDAELRTAGDLLADALPLPVPASATDPEVDAAVETVVAAAVDDDDPAPGAVETARAAGRVEIADATTTVPLSVVGPAVGNWFVLLRVTADRFETAAAEVDRVGGRLDLWDHPAAARAFRDVAGALRDTAATVRDVAVRALWLNPPHGLVDAEHRSVREYVTRTIESYSPHA